MPDHRYGSRQSLLTVTGKLWVADSFVDIRRSVVSRNTSGILTGDFVHAIACGSTQNSHAEIKNAIYRIDAKESNGNC